jgi:hypothetical protein
VVPLLYRCSGCKTLSDYLISAVSSIVLALVVIGAAMWWSRRQRTRSRPVRNARHRTLKPISRAAVTNGYSLVVDRLEAGGYSASSPDDPDLNVEAPTLAALDDRVRRSIRERLTDKTSVDSRLAYVWQDPGPARPESKIYLDVREASDGGFIAEGVPDLRVSANTLDGLAPAARAVVGMGPEITLGWVRTVRV